MNPPYTRYKKAFHEIVSWERYNPAGYMTDEQIDEWVKTERHRWMYRDESKID